MRASYFFQAVKLILSLSLIFSSTQARSENGKVMVPLVQLVLNDFVRTSQTTDGKNRIIESMKEVGKKAGLTSAEIDGAQSAFRQMKLENSSGEKCKACLTFVSPNQTDVIELISVDKNKLEFKLNGIALRMDSLNPNLKEVIKAYQDRAGGKVSLNIESLFLPSAHAAGPIVAVIIPGVTFGVILLLTTLALIKGGRLFTAKVTLGGTACCEFADQLEKSYSEYRQRSQSCHADLKKVISGNVKTIADLRKISTYRAVSRKGTDENKFLEEIAVDTAENVSTANPKQARALYRSHWYGAYFGLEGICNNVTTTYEEYPISNNPECVSQWRKAAKATDFFFVGFENLKLTQLDNDHSSFRNQSPYRFYISAYGRCLQIVSELGAAAAAGNLTSELPALKAFSKAFEAAEVGFAQGLAPNVPAAPKTSLSK